jgi:predicted nucleotidyltransferase
MLISAKISLDRLAGALEPERMYLFGSHARRTTVTGLNDVDVLVVVPVSSEPPYRRVQRADRVVGRHELPLDILVLTREEFEQGKSSDCSVQADLERDGRLLYTA